MMKPDNRRGQWMLLSAILLAMLAYGMTLPLFPFLLESFGGSGIHMGLLVAVYGGLQLLSAPVWGRLSDSVGRKPLLLLGTAGLAGALVVFSLARNLWMLYLGQAILGSLTSALFPVASAYMSDSSDTQSRVGAIGRIGAATGLGVVLGPGIGGILAFESVQFPFAIGGVWAIVVLLLMLVFLPESLVPARRRADLHTRQKQSGFGLRLACAAGRGPAAFGLFVVFAAYFGKSNFSGVFSLYAMQQFQYGTTEIGSLLMIMGLVYAISQGLLAGPVTKRISERDLIRFCLAGSAAGFTLLLVAWNYPALVAAITVLTVSNAALKPASLSMITRHSKGNYGAAMGVADVYMGLGRVLGPLWAGFAYDLHLGLPFMTGAVFFVLVLLTTLHNPDLTSQAESHSLEAGGQS